MNKSLTLIIVLALVSFNSIVSQKHNVTIEGQIIGYDGKSDIKYSIGSVSNSMNVKSVKPDSLGHFVISKHISETQLFSFYGTFNSKYHICRMVLQPNKHYSFISKGQQKVDWQIPYSPDIYTLEKTSIENKSFYRYNQGQVQYSKIHNYIHGSIFNDEWNLNKPNLLLDSLQTKIKKQLIVFDQLLRDKEINKELYDIAKINIEYMHAERLAMTISSTYQMPKYKIQDTLVRKELYEVYPKIFELYPVKGAKMEYLFNYTEYTNLYLTFREDYKDGVFKPIVRKGNTMHAPIYAKSGEVLSKEVNKHYQLVHTICNTASLVPSSLKLSEEYLDEHPEMSESWGGKLLQDVLIPNAEEYEKLKEMQIPEEVFVLNGEDIHSLSELSDSFNGRALLIDCWGTWCAPCRHQFYYMDTIKPLLKEKKMDMVYIAFEYTDDQQKWESIMKAYNLKGYHVIANEDLKADIKSKIGGVMSFPNFIIIDKNGEIVEKQAALASDGNKLYKQIEQGIK